MENWEKLIQEFSDTNQSARLFCELKGIKRTTFYYWLKKNRRATLELHQPAFIQIQKTCPSSLEIEYPNGVKIRSFATSLSLAELRQLIYV